MVRIWLNHWFSTVYHIIQLIRENEPDFHIIGTNEHAHAVYQGLCDEWYTEPSLHGDDYVDFCLSFCRAHKVDLFLPRRGMLDISRRRAEFEAIGVRVMADDHEKITPLNHKDQAYRLVREWGVAPVPEYRVVTTPDGFREAVKEISEQYTQVAFKFVHDEGGKSFRLLDDSRRGYAALFKKRSARITFDEACEALSEREEFAPLMVMPYLSGYEFSVDALKTEQGTILLPRLKDFSRIEQMVYREDILAMCQQLLDRTGLQHPCNIQFKYLGETPYFLEINTRMSGGIHMACAASGVNLPNIAVNQLRGISRPWQNAQKSAFIANAEIPIIL